MGTLFVGVLFGGRADGADLDSICCCCCKERGIISRVMDPTFWWLFSVFVFLPWAVAISYAIYTLFNTIDFSVPTVPAPSRDAANLLAFLMMLAVMGTAFTTIIPLESVIAEGANVNNLVLWLCVALMLWFVVLAMYAGPENKSALIWLNTHIMFLVVLPLTIAATAMNAVTIQNTRNKTAL